MTKENKEVDIYKDNNKDSNSNIIKSEYINIDNEENDKYVIDFPKKSSSILKKKISNSNSSELDINKLLETLIRFINSEYNSIYHFYKGIDKFNTGYVKYNDFLDYMISLNIEDLFGSLENLESVFKHLCNEKNILTLIDLYKNIYKDEEIDKYELNLRLTEVYGSSILAFKNIVFLNVEDALCNYINFEIVCEKVGLSNANIKSIWDEINIMNEEYIPLEIVLSIMNGELFIEEAYIAYNLKKSLLNQVVNFFQVNENLTKMNTDMMETNFEVIYEEPIILNKGHHKIFANECTHIVKLLESNVYFKFLTLEQRSFFTTLMDRKIMNYGDVLIKQNDDEAPIICIYDGKANLITYNLFGIEAPIGSVENNEVYGCDEAINEIPSNYEVKISSDMATVWILERSVYKENIKPMLEERQKNCTHILPVLRNVPILRYLSEEELVQISYAMKLEMYHPNHTIIKANTYDDKFYIICKGLVTVEKNTEGNKDKIVLSNLKKTDYFGELALIKNIKRTANVILDTEAILLSLSDSEFKRLLHLHFDKFLNRAKANYKRVQMKKKTSIQSEMVNLNSNTNIHSLGSYRSKNKIVTIQDNDDDDKHKYDNTMPKLPKGNISFTLEEKDHNNQKDDGPKVQPDSNKKKKDKEKYRKNKDDDKEKDKNKEKNKKIKNKKKEQT